MTSLVVKVGALAFIIFLDPQFSIDLQLIGGVIILQTAPSVALGLYTRWLHRGGLIAGWVAGMALAMWMLWQIPNAATKHAHFGGSAFPLSKFGFDSTKSIYVGFVAVLVNLLVAIVVTLILRATKVTDGGDDTAPEDYMSDAADVRAPRGEDEEDLAPEPIT